MNIMRKAYDLAHWDGIKLRDALSHIRDLKRGKAESLHMHIYDYVDLRRYARDVLDVASNSFPSEGFMGKIYDVSIFTKKSSILGSISFFGPEDVPLSHVVNPRRWSGQPEGGFWLDRSPGDHSLLFHDGELSSCLDELCLSMLVMGS